ncbi:hypothetical protein CRYUN_Cryun26dG0129400 [Craigia yunnanensis]
MESELMDWKVLHNSDSDSNSVLVNLLELKNLEEIEGDTEGMIRSNYFSLNNQIMYAKAGDFEDVVKESDIGFSDCMKKGAKLENSSEFDDGTTSAVELEGREGNPNRNEGSTIDEMKLYVKSVYQGNKKRVVWWKVPFELLRYCVFKVSPIWSFSVAATLMGFAILGHILYKMKRKS